VRGTFALLVALSGLAGVLLPSPAMAGEGPGVEVVQTTSNLSEHMSRLGNQRFGRHRLHGLPVIRVNDGRRYQRIRGFGAAMTDTSAWLLEEHVASSVQASTMESLFGNDGIRLAFLRVPIGASDFTADGRPYTYDDVPSGATDYPLASFSIAHDNAYVLPALQQALALQPGLRILATPWSPPAWMKSNGSLDNRAHHGTLLSSAGEAWATYLVRFLQAYAAAGVPVDAISPQNEPTNPTDYPGFELPPGQEAGLLTRYLLPALDAAGLHPAIYGGELGWDWRGVGYARSLMGTGAFKSLTGIAWHCYAGVPQVMTAIRARAPRLDQILSECSPGLVQFPTSEILIAALRNWASVVSLWNVALDPGGGPVQLPNTGCSNCTALVTVAEDTGRVLPTVNYFQLGQVSAFVQVGAQRVESSSFVHYRYRPAANIVTPGLDDVAFVNPDGRRVLVAYANTSRRVRFAVSWRGRSFTYTLPGRAVVTFSWSTR